MVATRVSSTHWALRFQTSVCPYWRQVKWSAARNSTWPLSAATRCHVMTQDAVHFSGAVSVRFGRENTACFTVRRVTPLSGDLSPNPLKSFDKKVSYSDLSNRPKASPIPEVT